MKQMRLRSNCPISFFLDILGDKWTLIILRDMIFKGKSSYSEFMQSEEKIATNILADRLNILESQKFVEKLVGNDKKSKFTYILTEKSINLIPVIIELAIWGTSYFPTDRDPDLIIKVEPHQDETINKYKELARKRVKELKKLQPKSL